MLKKRIGDQRQCSKKNVFWSLPELFAKVMKSETSLTGSKDVSLIEQSMDIFLFEQWRWQTWLCHLSLGSCMKYFLNAKKQTKNSIPWNIFRSGPVLNITVCSFSAHVVMLSSQSGDCCGCLPLRQLGETLKLPALQWKMDREMVVPLVLWIHWCPIPLPSQASLGFVAWGFFTKLVGQERVLGCSLCIRSL